MIYLRDLPIFLSFQDLARFDQLGTWLLNDRPISCVWSNLLSSFQPPRCFPDQLPPALCVRPRRFRFRV